MDDLISRQAAIDVIVNTVSEIGLHDNSEVARYGATFRQHEIIDIIEGMPSAQPEIIRCKDCNSADFAGCSGAVCYCMEHGTYMFQWDYCGRAERINNGQAD